jgi:Protein of Unknown function (DUF2784)
VARFPRGTTPDAHITAEGAGRGEQTGTVLLAAAVAVLHGAAVLFMLTGALLALRWPWLLFLHAPVALAILGFNLAGADCPLTDLQKELVQRAGGVPYRGGFLEHSLFAPLGLDVHAPAVQASMYTAAFALNALGYGLLVARARAARAPCRARGIAREGATRTSAPGRGRCRCGRRRRTPGPPAAAPPAGRRTSSRTAAPVRR